MISLVLSLLVISFHALPCCYISKPISTITTNLTGPLGVAFSADGTCLAVANNIDETVLLYTSASCGGYNDNSYSATINDPGNNPFSVAFSPVVNAGPQCLAVSSNGPGTASVKLYSSTTGCKGFAAATPTTINNVNNPLGISFSPNGQCLAVANEGTNQVLIYNSSTGCSGFGGTSVAISISSPKSLAFSPNGVCLAVVNASVPNITLYSSQTVCGFTSSSPVAATITTGLNNPKAVAFSPDGTCIAVSNATNPATVTLYHSSTCSGFEGLSPYETIATPGRIGGIAAGIAFSPDGSCLAVTNLLPAAVLFYAKLNPNITGLAAVCQGSSVTLTADVSPFQDTTTPTYLSYQWQLNGANISGATSTTYTTDATLVAGTYVYTVQVTDPNGTCAVTSPAFNLVVDTVVGNPATFTACSGVALHGIVTATSSSGSAMSSYSFTQPTHGQLSSLSSPDGSFEYISNSGYAGSDSFTFTATDGNGCVSAPATVSITVDTVVGTPASFSTCSGVALHGSVTATSSSGSAMSSYSFTQPSHGQVRPLSSPDGSFEYISNSGYAGTDSFTFTATDGNGCVSAPATVTIAVDKAAVVLTSVGTLPNVGVPVTLVATPTSGSAPFTFKWSDGFTQTGSTAVSRVVEPEVNTPYSVIIIDSNGCQSDPSDSLTVAGVARSSLSQAVQEKYCTIS